MSIIAKDLGRNKEHCLLTLLDPEECRDNDLIVCLLEEKKQYDVFHPRASKTAWL
jgi:hypothetical protein